MGETHSDGVVETFANARVVQNELTSYYIPLEVGDIDPTNVEEEITTLHPDLLLFTRNEDSVRDPSRRAIYWGQLQERVRNEDEKFPLTYDPEVTGTDSVDELKLPWRIAMTTNKAVYAAYLAAHGKPNSYIAEALGVSTGTISQYLSDFKSERR